MLKWSTTPKRGCTWGVSPLHANASPLDSDRKRLPSRPLSSSYRQSLYSVCMIQLHRKSYRLSEIVVCVSDLLAHALIFTSSISSWRWNFPGTWSNFIRQRGAVNLSLLKFQHFKQRSRFLNICFWVSLVCGETAARFDVAFEVITIPFILQGYRTCRLQNGQRFK